MYNDVSLELRNYIRRNLTVIQGITRPYANCSGFVFFPGEDRHLYEECKKWYQTIQTYYKTSYQAMCLTKLGRFYMIRPYQIDTHDDAKIVKFEFERYEKKSFMDWFDTTGENDGHLQGQVGKIINERTCPEYYASKLTS